MREREASLMNAATSFWKSVPRKSMTGFLVGVFFIFTTTGIANDIMVMGRQPTFRYVVGVLLSGLFAAAYAFTGFRLRSRFWKAFFPLFAVQVGVMTLLGRLFPDRPQVTPMLASDLAELQSRLTLDGTVIIAMIALGYACFVYVTVSEAKRYARVHAEMKLAAEIHGVLVPGIDRKIANFEFCGRAFPSSEVGGDLIDVFEHDLRWIAYIADVSGHGVAPGVVMGMVKSAARMQLSSAEESEELLERLNSVLYPIKKPEMFVTFAYLAWNGKQLEYSTAGHPPMLHYHAATKEISELACSNLPVGMFGGHKFVSSSLVSQPNDLLLMLTDGLLEVTNASDEEFGLAAVKAVLSERASDPLKEILAAVLDATNRHGHASDDRSLLLVRFGASA
jgi:serine phosphatase RsbU (regulator of sigma subunit)